MLKVALPSKWTFIACMLWCNLLMSQYGLQSILVKHPFQVLTARTGYQNMYQDSKGWFYIATSDGINVNPLIESHLFAPLKSVPKGVKTNNNKITVIIYIGNAHFL